MRRWMLTGLIAMGLYAAEPIEQRIKQQARAWSEGDLESFCSVYAEEAVFVTEKGVTQGRTTILERYRAAYPDRAAMGKLELEVVQQHPVANCDGTGVVVIGRWSLSYPDRETKSGYTMLLFELKDGQWQIVRDASM